MRSASLALLGLVGVLSCQPADRAADGAPSTDRRPGAPAPAGPAAVAEPDSAACWPPEPASVTLEGRVRAETRYGPPGYGESPETDSRIRIHLLELPAPIDVCLENAPDNHGGPRRALGLREIHLVGLPPDQLAGLVGQRVRVRGSLVYAAWAHDFTPVVLHARDLRLAGGGPASS